VGMELESLSIEEKKRERAKKLAQFVVHFHTELETESNEWRPQWEELNNMILPRKGNVYDNTSRGEKRVRLYDITGVLANEELASALHTNLTNPTVQFCEFSTGDSSLDVKPKVAAYLQKRTEILHSVLNGSNYQTEVHESYLDLGSVGTRVMRIDEDDEEIVKFSCRPIHEFSACENQFGIIDTLSRKKEYTGKQLLEKFGDNLLKNSHLTDEEKEQCLHKYTSRPLDKFSVIEMFIPTSLLKRKKLSNGTRPYSTIYVLEDGAYLIKQDWFNELVYAVSRWSKTSGESFGRGPGSKALPAILMLNELKKLVVQGNQLAIKPPVMVPDDGTYPGFKIFPGAVNYYRSGTRDEIKPFNNGARVDVADWLIDKLADDIRKAFFIDKIRLPEINRMTREETVVRRDENLRAWAPILGRQEREDLLPTIRRVDAIIERRGLYPTPPSELEGATLEVKYSSQVARVQKATLADNADFWVNSMVQLANIAQRPDILDGIDFIKYSRYTAFTRSVPADLVKSEDDIAQLQADRAAQNQDAMDLQRQQIEAQTAKDASKAALDSANLPQGEPLI
jgi:hypothetical protein